MADYQLYYFNIEGRISHAWRMEQALEGDAIVSTSGLPHANALELWNGERLVLRVAPPAADSEGFVPHIPGLAPVSVQQYLLVS
jgi:hypothetical protein